MTPENIKLEAILGDKRMLLRKLRNTRKGMGKALKSSRRPHKQDDLRANEDEFL